MSKQPPRPTQSSRQDRAKGTEIKNIVVLSGMLACVIWALGVFYFFDRSETGFKILVAVLPPAVAAPIFKRLFYFVWERGERHLLSLADEVIAKDPRPPIVFLRSFD